MSPRERFAYYDRLSTAERAAYDASDRILVVRAAVSLARPAESRAVADALRKADRDALQKASQGLIGSLVAALSVPQVRVRVAGSRPRDGEGELHAIYVPADGHHPARIRMWWLTAKRRLPVAPKTYLRELLHELGHHLDYTLYNLPVSLHTRGFFARESSLLRQVLDGTSAVR